MKDNTSEYNLWGIWILYFLNLALNITKVSYDHRFQDHINSRSLWKKVGFDLISLKLPKAKLNCQT